jgi:hypothetical protein
MTSLWTFFEEVHVLKLMKWAFYGVIGYAVYEFIAGMLEEADLPQRNEPANTSRMRSRQSRPAIMTGGSGQGEYVPVSDSTGVEHREKVGRGVIHR